MERVGLRISIRQGESFQLPITIDDPSAMSARLLVWNDDSIIYDITEPFVDGEVTMSVNPVEEPVGVYSYSVTVTFSDGVTDILPDSNCKGCKFPEFEICKGNPDV